HPLDQRGRDRSLQPRADWRHGDRAVATTLDGRSDGERRDASILRSGRASALQALAGEVVEIVLPIGVLVSTEREKIGPAVDPSRMHVVENEPHRVIADRIDLENGDVLLAGDGLALVG